MKRVLFLFLALLPTAADAAPDVDRRAVAVALSEQFVVPGYVALADAAREQSAAWREFCAAPDRAGLPKLERTFVKSAGAWSTVEFVHYGPIAEDFRFERMAHWPERGSAVSRGLKKLLSGKETNELDPERFAQASVAVQGLTALERLLFDDKREGAFLDRSPMATRHCAVSKAIAEGLERLTSRILDEWRKPGGMLDRLRQADETLAREAVTRFATDLFALYETVADRKLSAVAGESIDEVRPTLAEGWRSERTMQAVIRNLDAAGTMTRLMLPADDSKAASILESIASAKGKAGDLPSDLGAAAADPGRRGDVTLLIDFIRSARDLSALALPAALDITLGFNSLDGD